MIEFFNSVDMQRLMSENCYADAKRFGTEKFLNNWYEMTKTLHERLMT